MDVYIHMLILLIVSSRPKRLPCLGSDCSVGSDLNLEILLGRVG